MALTVMQLLPALNVGGVERGTIEIAAALIADGHRAIVVSNGGRLVAELEALGALHIMLPIGEKRLSTLRCIRQLRRLILEHRVDIVHARSRLPAWIGHLAIRALPTAVKPHWVTTVHGPYTVNRYSRIMTSGERVVAISGFIRAYVLNNYPHVDPHRITVVPRCVDEAHYNTSYTPSEEWRRSWQLEFPSANTRQLLVLPGRLTRWKGQTVFIEMMARLVADGLNVHGIFAGGASGRGLEFENELRASVTALGLSDRISFAGNRSDLRDILAHCDLAYSLTLEPEAFGRTTIEALGLGTPVVGFDHGGTGEILAELLPQGLVRPFDIDGIVARTKQFLERPPHVPSEHQFTLRRMQSAVLDIYTQLAQK